VSVSGGATLPKNVKVINDSFDISKVTDIFSDIQKVCEENKEDISQIHNKRMRRAEERLNKLRESRYIP